MISHTAIEPIELRMMLETGQAFALFDVRDPMEAERGHIPGATNLPRRSIELRIGLLVRNTGTPIVTVDDDSGRAALAAETLSSLGYCNVKWLSGGIGAWRRAGYQTVSGSNVPSKRYGEEAHRDYGIPDIDAEILAGWQRDGKEFLLFDVRTPGEYEEACVPGAMSGSGFDLALHAGDLRKYAGPVVVHCAGRTRSLIAAQTLREMGVGKAVALRNGTMGWLLANKPLEHGAQRMLTEASAESRSYAKAAVQEIPEISGIEGIESATLASWLVDDENLYLFDVRQLDEYELEHVPGSQAVPGGQLVQRADDFIAVRNARIVLVDDDEVRACLCALWLRRIGFPKICVLSGGIGGWKLAGYAVEAGRVRQKPAGWDKAAVRVKQVSLVEAERHVRRSAGLKILDVDASSHYCKGHVPGAVWIPRGWLEQRVQTVVPDLSTQVLVTCNSGIHSVYAAARMGELGYRNVSVLKGGVSAWKAMGYPLEMAQLPPQDDVLLPPYKRGEQAIRDYLSWEVALVEGGHESASPNPFAGLTYGESLRLIADLFGDHDALIMGQRRWSFKDAMREINRASARLLNSGFRRGDRLALWMPNRPEFLWCWLGASQLGILTVVINTRLKGQEVAYQLGQSESRGVVVPGDGAFKDFIGDILSFRDQLPRLDSIIALDPTTHPNIVDWSELDGLVDTDNLPLEEDAESPVLISYSSGTTGMPKGALIAHSVFRKAWDIGSYVDQTSEDKLLLAVPLFGSFAMMNGILPCWVRGSAVVVMERFEPNEFLRMAESEACTMVHLLVPMIAAISELPREAVRRQLSRVRTANVVTLDESVFKQVVDDLGIPGALIGYGLTESTTAVVRNFWNDPWEVRSRSQGFPLPGLEVRVVDPETGRNRVAGEAGEILVRGYCVMKGYYNKPEETRKAIDEDGWLHTGDVGVFREDGRLAFLYRLGDSYKTNGFNISPSEVEAVIRREAGVADVAVFGIDDPIAGQVGVACLVTQPGRFDESALLGSLGNHLPSYKIPRHIIVMDSLPVTPGTGKVKKARLREMVVKRLSGC